MRHTICFFLLLAFGYARAGDPVYAAASIPPALLKNAHAVKRFERSELRIYSPRHTVLRRTCAITILDAAGDRFSAFSFTYDNLQQVRSVEGRLYDAAGKLVKKMKPKELVDISAVGEQNLMDDSRRKQHDFYYRNYPYTVEYEVEVRSSHTLFFPPWNPQSAEDLAVENSAHAIVSDTSFSVRYRSYNYNGLPVVQVEKDKKTLAWQVAGLPAVSRPFASPAWRELTTTVYFAPAAFEIQGYQGSLKSWEELGHFQYTLNKGRDELPPELTDMVKRITDTIRTDRGKALALYEFMQKQTRYVSVQLGIGGWQPVPASSVARTGYGDCKGLTNYLHSLLKAAGVRSAYALVVAGNGKEDNLVEDFPSLQFNHALLCVPLATDSLWFECTSATSSPGYVGGFAGNRKALLVDEHGGHVVSTPRYGVEENRRHRTVKALVKPNGSLQMIIRTRYSGLAQDELSQLVNRVSKPNLEALLQQDLDLSTYHVNGFSYTEQRSEPPMLDEELDISVSDYANITGKRLYIQPNVLVPSVQVPDDEVNRTADYVLTNAQSEESSYDIEVPDGYEAETLPPDVSLQTAFGTYTITTRFAGNRIRCKRMFRTCAGRFDAGEQSALRAFLEEVRKSDRQKVVLVKNR